MDKMKRLVLAMPQCKFDKMCIDFGWNDDNIENEQSNAFISIIGTKGVLENYLNEGNTEHHFKRNHKNVLNLEFDDVSQDMDFGTYKAYSLSEEQARQIYVFVNENIGKDIFIHCRAGQSRSVAVARFIMECYSDNYSDLSSSPNYSRPNVDVLTKLKRIVWEKTLS